ncbi:MAG: ABC transporter ATP-binding protein FepC [Syntrophus sp. SKADARSKE-3]|nr:ABC transporter ATP-binding protein FepC [Syntrophus sp. SKADARSKE-3]
MPQPVHIENVGFQYGLSQWVLRDVSLTIGQGVFIGIIGPNGSGKTTLLRLINGLMVPQEGRIFVGGHPLESMKRREIARIMAAVPQDEEMVFPFTALEIVLMGRSPHIGLLRFETEDDLHIARRAMAQADILPFADRPMSTLSGGERQRVMIARALAQEPKILLLDESTAFLDLHHQIAFFDLMAGLNREAGMTIIAVTHDINLAALYCDRIVLLNEGRVHADGIPEKVITSTNVCDVYRVAAAVDISPTTGRPRVTVLGSQINQGEGSRFKSGPAPQL